MNCDDEYVNKYLTKNNLTAISKNRHLRRIAILAMCESGVMSTEDVARFMNISVTRVRRLRIQAERVIKYMSEHGITKHPQDK